MTKRKKYICFKEKDVKFDGKEYYCEIPVFSNVVLNYNATKDFSEYLRLYECKEWPFFYLRKKRNGKVKKKVNEFKWFAKFYFTQKPKDGKLEVWFY